MTWPPTEEHWHMLPYTYFSVCLFEKKLLALDVMDNILDETGLVLQERGKPTQGLKIFVHQEVEPPRRRRETLRMVIVRDFSGALETLIADTLLPQIFGGELVEDGHSADVILYPDCYPKTSIQTVQTVHPNAQLHPVSWLLILTGWIWKWYARLSFFHWLCC